MTSQIEIRTVTEADFSTIVVLNKSEETHTSPMDFERLHLLDGLSDYHRVVLVNNQIAGFLLAMKKDSKYSNENFEWFSSRYDSFLYVDRIVIGNQFQGLKLGKLLYEDLFAYARAQDIKYITCEYNIVPPNVPSQIFHDKFSFKQVGDQWLNNHSKHVSLQVAEV